MKRTKRSTQVASLLLGILLVLAPSTAWPDRASDGGPELDRAAVFCTFYALSGERPDDRDIEDFRWSTGKPTFSAFKPAEMFSRNGLREARRELHRRVEGIGPDTVFRWETEGIVVRRSGGGLSFRSGFGRKDLPHATPLIQAEISRAGWKRLRSALKRLSSSSEAKTPSKDSPPRILLEPLQVEDRMERRNIALEEVTIPVRVVVFQPVALETTGAAGRKTIPVSP
jgi:hypothetical protein